MDDAIGLAVLAGVLTALGALGSALVAGVFFAFSGFVMAGLDRSGAVHAVPAMQGINVAAVRPPLMSVLFGTLVLLLLGWLAQLLRSGWSAASWSAIAAFAVYGAGVVVVTAVGNVPLNNGLAGRVDPAEAAAAWQAFDRPWRRLNHVRTVAAALGAVLMLIALRLG